MNLLEITVEGELNEYALGDVVEILINAKPIALVVQATEANEYGNADYTLLPVGDDDAATH